MGPSGGGGGDLRRGPSAPSSVVSSMGRREKPQQSDLSARTRVRVSSCAQSAAGSPVCFMRKRPVPGWAPAVFMEAAGVEPASARGSSRVSTCVDRCEGSPWGCQRTAPSGLAAVDLALPVATVGESQPDLSSPQDLPRAGRSGDGHALLRSQCQIVVGSCDIFRCDYRGYRSPRHATLESPNTSKP